MESFTLQIKNSRGKLAVLKWKIINNNRQSLSKVSCLLHFYQYNSRTRTRCWYQTKLCTVFGAVSQCRSLTHGFPVVKNEDLPVKRSESHVQRPRPATTSTTKEYKGVFSLIRKNDLIWSIWTKWNVWCNSPTYLTLGPLFILAFRV